MSRKRALDISKENRRLGRLGPILFLLCGILGIAGIGISIVLSIGSDAAQTRFLHSYLLNVVYFLSLSLGALFFVQLHHLVRAGWSVVVRRFAEVVSGNLWLLALLLVPIFFKLDSLYHWANEEAVAHDALLLHKQGWLNEPFFILRCLIYSGVWVFLSQYFLRKSIAQDSTGELMLTVRMERFSGPAMVLFAITTSFAGFDLLMSLDAHWYSTMFGVYFFSGSVLGFLALLPVLTSLLQRTGRLTHTITREHYHDMGKLIFAFTVFWAYIAFSQYMLIWYANLPEETGWFLRRQTGDWANISLLLLYGHFMVPFFLWLPRFMKRNKWLLVGPALWMLAMHWFDLYWLIMPQLSPDRVSFSFVDVTSFIGVGGLYFAALALRLRNQALVPEKDPRLEESLVFESA